MAGINRWKTPAERAFQKRDLASATKGLPIVRIRPCVFISYRLVDSEVAEHIAKFLMETADCDVYFSNDDAKLMYALDAANDLKIVQAIDAGIAEATHLLGIISNRTRGSWWVPYEFGACRTRKIEVALLLLEDVSELPSYMRIAHDVLADTTDLGRWASRVRPLLSKTSELRVLSAAPHVSQRSREIRYVSWPLRND
jgi:hypothetical protein